MSFFYKRSSKGSPSRRRVSSLSPIRISRSEHNLQDVNLNEQVEALRAFSITNQARGNEGNRPTGTIPKTVSFPRDLLTYNPDDSLEGAAGLPPPPPPLSPRITREEELEIRRKYEHAAASGFDLPANLHNDTSNVSKSDQITRDKIELSDELLSFMKAGATSDDLSEWAEKIQRRMDALRDDKGPEDPTFSTVHAESTNYAPIPTRASQLPSDNLPIRTQAYRPPSDILTMSAASGTRPSIATAPLTMPQNNVNANDFHEEAMRRGYIPAPAPLANSTFRDYYQPPPATPQQNISFAPEREYHQPRIQNCPFSLAHFVKNIPPFDGNPDNLPLFSQMVRAAASNVGPGGEIFIIQALASKLVGKARDAYGARLAYYTSTEKLLADLTTQYSNIGLADDILAKLKLVYQIQGESAGDYGARVQTLYNRLITIYDSAPGLTVSEREARKRAADRDALDYFMFGLSPPLDHQVGNRRPTSLREAMSTAIDLECRQMARRANPLLMLLSALQPGTGRQSSSPPNSAPALPAYQLPSQPPAPIVPSVPALTPMAALTAVAPQLATLLPAAQYTASPELTSQALLQQQIAAALGLPLAPTATTAPITSAVTSNPIPSANVMAVSATAIPALTCNYCKLNNHTEEYCNTKRMDTLSCNFCRRPGHVMSECRALERKRQRDSQNGNGGNDGQQNNNNNGQNNNNGNNNNRNNNGNNNNRQNNGNYRRNNNNNGRNGNGNNRNYNNNNNNGNNNGNNNQNNNNSNNSGGNNSNNNNNGQNQGPNSNNNSSNNANSNNHSQNNNGPSDTNNSNNLN